MIARLILAIRAVASWLDGLTDRVHLTTDPACNRYRRPRQGSRLHLLGYGAECRRCEQRRAWSLP